MTKEIADKLEEDLIIRQYRQIRERGHGDLEISVKDGRLIKLWEHNKIDLAGINAARLREQRGPC